MSVFKWANNGLVVSLFAFSVFMLSGCSDDDDGDENPPVISNLSHADNEKVIGDRSITFSVDVTDDVGATVSVSHNSNAVSLSQTGDTYSGTIILEDNLNNVISIVASDADNTTTQTITLNYPFLAFTNGQSASVVIGQPDFDSFATNRGGSVADNAFSALRGIIVHNNIFYTADRTNNRVLGFNSIPETYDDGINASANLVIGQTGFEQAAAGLAANQLNNPYSIATNGEIFLVGQKNTSGGGGGGRVSLWYSLPTSNSAADVVIGQADFGEDVIACNETTFAGGVEGLFVVNNKIIASDTENNRVLIWNSIPTTNGEPADIVLGQQDFTHCAANDGNNDGDNIDPEDGTSASTLYRPGNIWSDGTRLVVADKDNFRVLIWNTFPTSNFQPADAVIGQADLQSAVFPIPVTTSSIAPHAMSSNGNQLFVYDVPGERILIWDSIPTSTTNIINADRVLGASDTDVNDTLANNAEIDGVLGIAFYKDKLLLTDVNNSRVLIFEAP